MLTHCIYDPLPKVECYNIPILASVMETHLKVLQPALLILQYSSSALKRVMEQVELL